MTTICVFCSSSERIDPRLIRLAGEVGTQLAARGHALVSGGGAVSMMGAVARAARAGGAHTTGVIPRGLLDREVGDLDADELVVVEDMRTRKREMDGRADAFLVLPGGIGTLEELFEVWVARTLRMSDKPVVVLDPYGDLAALRMLLEALQAGGFVSDAALGELRWHTDAAAAIADLEDHLLTRSVAPPGAGELLEADSG